MSINFFAEFSVHEFIIKEQIIQTGKRKGEKRYLTSLIIPPFTFRRKTNFNYIDARDHFYCTGCESQGKIVKASCILKNILDDGKPEYALDLEVSIFYLRIL